MTGIILSLPGRKEQFIGYGTLVILRDPRMWSRQVRQKRWKRYMPGFLRASCAVAASVVVMSVLHAAYYGFSMVMFGIASFSLVVEAFIAFMVLKVVMLQ